MFLYESKSGDLSVVYPQGHQVIRTMVATTKVVVLGLPYELVVRQSSNKSKGGVCEFVERPFVDHENRYPRLTGLPFLLFRCRTPKIVLYHHTREVPMWILIAFVQGLMEAAVRMFGIMMIMGGGICLLTNLNHPNWP